MNELTLLIACEIVLRSISDSICGDTVFKRTDGQTDRHNRVVGYIFHIVFNALFSRPKFSKKSENQRYQEFN